MKSKKEVFDPFPFINRFLASVSNAASDNKSRRYIFLLLIVTAVVCGIMVYLDSLPAPIVSKTKFLGLPLYATGDFAVGWFAFGNVVSIGFFAFGGMAFGAIAIGGIGIGIVSVGGLAIGLLLAFGGGALGFYSFGGVSVGGFAYAGQGVAKGWYVADGRQHESLIS